MNIVRGQKFCPSFLALECLYSSSKGSVQPERKERYHLACLGTASRLCLFRQNRVAYRVNDLNYFVGFSVFIFCQLCLLISCGMSTLPFPPPQSIHVWNSDSEWFGSEGILKIISFYLPSCADIHSTILGFSKPQPSNYCPWHSSFVLFPSLSLHSFLQMLKGQKAKI